MKQQKHHTDVDRCTLPPVAGKLVMTHTHTHLLDVVFFPTDVFLLRFNLFPQVIYLTVQNKPQLFQVLVLLLQVEDGVILGVQRKRIYRFN